MDPDELFADAARQASNAAQRRASEPVVAAPREVVQDEEIEALCLYVAQRLTTNQKPTRWINLKSGREWGWVFALSNGNMVWAGKDTRLLTEWLPRGGSELVERIQSRVLAISARGQLFLVRVEGAVNHRGLINRDSVAHGPGYGHHTAGAWRGSRAEILEWLGIATSDLPTGPDTFRDEYGRSYESWPTDKEIQMRREKALKRQGTFADQLPKFFAHSLQSDVTL